MHRQKSRPRSSIAVSEGNVVIVFEDNLHRSQWTCVPTIALEQL